MTRPLGRRPLARLLSSAALSLALVMGGTTVVHASDLVDVPDANLAACIRAKLAASGLTDELSAANLASLTKLSCGSIADLTGVGHLTGVSELAARVNDSVDLGPLADMPSLRRLSLFNSGLTSLNSLPTLADLTFLNLGFNKISDLAPLAGFTSLATLSLQSNLVTDLSSLADRPALRSLNVGYCPLNSAAVSVIAGLTQLTTLYLDQVNVSDLAPLAGLTNLQELSLTSNQISDIGPLANMPDLAYLNLRSNQVADISALSGATKLWSLTLDGNQVADLSPLAGATSLTYLNAQSSGVETLGEAGSLSGLKKVFLRRNTITSIAALKGAALTQVDLASNQISDVSPLSAVASDASVDLYQNKIRDLSPLPDQVKLRATEQSLDTPAQAETGVAFDPGVRGVDGTALCPDSWPEPVACQAGKVTYRFAGHYVLTFISADSAFSAALHQTVGPEGHFETPSPVRLTGATKIGSVLQVPSDIWVPTPDSLSYEWFAGDQARTVSGATYRPTSADVGKPVKVCMTAKRDSFATLRLCSAETAPIAGGTITSFATPKISGKARIGARLTAKPGSWQPGLVFSYRWQRNGKDIAGATGASYRLVRKDRRAQIRVKVTGRSDYYLPLSIFSAPVKPRR